ncbi:FumA C-terminus/TtdB family hydratase beta subunit [Desulfomonile tiedjei]|uniref:Hydro-lyase family enzyme, Fe-S type, tartrate/fumarate subfamily n=1 Tax=Desulfomonile tiedjei (strain ATCC 49306 / DSM 6799 / DCB-1) TaxID=706587 RepID=I4C4W0_DESTA|nr:FumA C-terminus/TtdB family hydratase beta subunit [Desulfomonile tiedjei]AFM24601.1 hydro-lyase family enzyme, Fe-S type, tartrate/fumarate subfamily [Desulfomonile tiedjei DSM 6799]
MTEYHLKSPFSEQDVRQLKAGDIVFFDGLLFGIRDLTQIYMFDQNHEPPVSLVGAPCIHTAPSLRKVGDKWEKICVGTTTSTRMERFTPDLIRKYGVRAIIGKGGLYQGSLDAMKEYGAVYLAIVGGAAALETKQIEEIEAVYWEHLHPEALYQFRVKDFGPLTVAMDSHGRHLYDEVKKEALERLPKIYRELGV